MIQQVLQHMNSQAWDQAYNAWPHAQAMKSCVQDAVFHAEGDVWTHTCMVYDQLGKDADEILQATALYHDVAKPQTRTLIQEPLRVRVSHPHHSRLGAQKWWQEATQQNWLTWQQRLMVYRLIQHHQRIFHVWTSSDMMRTMAQIGCDTDFLKLIQFAKADNWGRICPNAQQTHDDLCLVEQWLEENPIQWANPHHRLAYFENVNRHPDFVPPMCGGSRVTLMCGIPASGKDTYVTTHLANQPVVSMDQIRENLKIDPRDNQGQVIQAALEQSRVCLRKRQDFVWNATNLSKLAREKIISLCRAYDAYVTIVVITTPWDLCVQRNNQRKSPVPQQVLANMLAKWEPPSLTEAHEIIYQ